VDDEDQIIQVYDPNGMPVTQLMRPPATEQDFAALMTGLAAQNQEGVVGGYYPQPNQAPPAPETPPSAPAAPQAAPTPPQAPAATNEEPAANNLTDALGGAGQAIGTNLRDMLWEAYSANTGAGRNDIYVRAARYVTEERGSPLSRDEFMSFADEFASAMGDPTKRSAVLARWVQSKPEAQEPVAPPQSEAPSQPAPEPPQPPAAPGTPPVEPPLTEVPPTEIPTKKPTVVKGISAVQQILEQTLDEQNSYKALTTEGITVSKADKKKLDLFDKEVLGYKAFLECLQGRNR
jgi:hypothetical protein